MSHIDVQQYHLIEGEEGGGQEVPYFREPRSNQSHANEEEGIEYRLGNSWPYLARRFVPSMIYQSAELDS